MNSIQAAESMPICWVVGPNVSTSAVEHIRSLGIQVELADQAPDQAQWVVPSMTLCYRDFESFIFLFWRPTAAFEQEVWHSGRLSHYANECWTESITGRSASALNHCVFAVDQLSWPAADPFDRPGELTCPPPAVFLLTADWAQADQLLELAIQGDVSEMLVASPSPQALAELAGSYSQIATMITPSRRADQLPWTRSSQQVLTLSPIDFHNPQAFANAVSHSIWLLTNDPEEHRKRVPSTQKAWGHIQNFHPLQEQTRIGLFFAGPKDAQLGQELAAHRSEMVVFSWDLEAFGRFIVAMNPTAVFFDPQLVHFPEHPEISLLENSAVGSKINTSLGFSRTRLGLLPSQWKATGLDSLFQKQAQAEEESSQVQAIFAHVQSALSRTEQCRFQFHLDGGWTLETEAISFQWSPSRQLLRLYHQGKTTSVPWSRRIACDIVPRWLYLHTDIRDQAIVVYQKFLKFSSTPNLLTYSEPAD